MGAFSPHPGRFILRKRSKTAAAKPAHFTLREWQADGIT